MGINKYIYIYGDVGKPPCKEISTRLTILFYNTLLGLAENGRAGLPTPAVWGGEQTRGVLPSQISRSFEHIEGLDSSVQELFEILPQALQK